MADLTLEEMIEEQRVRHERIWNIVNKLTYEEFKAMQMMFAPVEEDE